MNNEEQQFLDYCYSYYGKGGLYAHQYCFSKKEMLLAHKLLKCIGNNISVELDGERVSLNYDYDSFGREMVRDICSFRVGWIVEYQSFINAINQIVDISSITTKSLTGLAARLNKLAIFA